MRHTQTCLSRRRNTRDRRTRNTNRNSRSYWKPCPLHNRCMWSHRPLKARTSRSRSWYRRSHRRRNIYPLHMRHNQASCRNRRTRMPFPPRRRCMLQCRLSFCICQLRTTRMFLTPLYMLNHNSRPPTTPAQSTQHTRSQTKHAQAACRTPRARLYT